MRIVYNTNAVVPSRSAHSLHGVKMCEAFGKNGHEAVLVVPAWPAGREAVACDDIHAFYGVSKCFEIHRTRFPVARGRLLTYCLFLADLARKLRAFRPHVVYGPFAMGSYWAALQGYAVILESHALFWEGHPLERLFFELLIRSKRFKKLVVITSAMKDMYLQAGYLSGDRIQIAYNGAAPCTLEDCIKPWSGGAGRLQVGYAGHLYRGRGIDIVLELSARMPDIDFHVIGGTDEDLTYWKARWTAENVFFHGYVLPREVYKYRNSCDVLLAPYQENTTVAGGKLETGAYMSPMKVFEYMSSNKPIVASDLPVVREVLNERNAILVLPGDVAAWRQALIRLQNPSLRRELAEKAYLDFTTHYQWAQRARRVLREGAYPSVSKREKEED